MSATAKEHFRIVCLGGSAGALEAYEGILRHLPAETGMAFVIAAHRSSTVASMLPEILARVTAMPVIQVQEGMLLEPNRVFLMPPGTELTVNNDRFVLQPASKVRGWPKTISICLLSLAVVYRERVVAIILSGLDYDGIAALKAIKAAGGVTFAQANPEFDDMPRHAVETGHVDFVLPPEEIAAALLGLTDDSYAAN